VSGGAGSGSATGGRGRGDPRYGCWGAGGSALGSLPAAVLGVAGSAGAAPSSPLAGVPASSGVSLGSWALGPALGWGGHAGVSPALGCGSAGARGFGHSRAEQQVVQPWGGTDRQDGREARARGVLPCPGNPALTWESGPVVGDAVHGQERRGGGHQHPRHRRPHHRRVGLEGRRGWKRAAAVSPSVPPGGN